MTQIAMPRLSDSMEEGTIVTWLVDDGSEVEAGQAVVEIETDKATMVYETELAGRLTILAGIDAVVKVGEPIASVGENGAGGSPESAPAAGQEKAGGADGDRSQDREPIPAAGVETVSSPRSDRVRVSPLARRAAARLGVSIVGLTGSGPYGRIMKADVLRGAEAAPAVSPQEDAPERVVRMVEPTRHQKLVARRMVEAKTTAPEFTLSATIEMGAAVELREDLKRLDSITPSFNDFVVKAAALALQEHPRVNSSWRDEKIEMYEQVNVGVAVAKGDELIVPVIGDADRLSLVQIAERSRLLVEAVKDGTVTPAQLEGGTFSVSNLGMFDVDEFEAILNTPQAAILAVGAIRREPAFDDAGGVTVGRPMRVTLTCDHRVIYGAHGAAFLQSLRRYLEEPLRLLLSSDARAVGA